MDGQEGVVRLLQSWVEFFREVKRPSVCIRCPGTRIWWNGRRVRSASGLVDGRTVTVPRVPCRRARCAACRASWALLPPGMIPGRHFGLSVAAEALSRRLFAPERASREAVAQDLDLSSRTVGRFEAHTAHVVEPAWLQRLVLSIAGFPLLPRLESVKALAEKARTAARRLVLERAGQVLCLLEAVAAGLGMAAPGLASVLWRVIGGRRGLSTYKSPSIPADAWRAGLGLASSMPM